MRRALALTLVLLAGATGCAGGPAGAAAPVAASPAQGGAGGAGVSRAPASGGAVAPGILPEPDAATAAAYVAALDAIDPEIVGGQAGKAVDRGLNQCSSIRQYPGNRPRLVELTQVRFTGPAHPDGFGPDTAARILDVVHAGLCPAF
ncbi:hypothetical protein KNE206_04100 [Kitasatospora sp. NE20-6]|uniref:hypothetical protein n=1 Tax=Kitasatospora sp. NE20-6 TaxID=2859066 RepID=UPI0034DC5686